MVVIGACPPAARDEVKGVGVPRQGKGDQALRNLGARCDGRGVPYYWVGFERRRQNPAAGADLRAVIDGAISVTPLMLNLTDNSAHSTLKERLAIGQDI